MESDPPPSLSEARPKTCPMAVLMSELGRTDPAAQAVTRSLLLRWRSDLATGVRAMQMDGTAPAALDPDRSAGAIVAGIQGGVAILLATGSSADLEAVLDLLLEQLGTPEEVAGSTDPVLTRRLVGVHIDDLR
jgi:hypothetical protein